MSWIIDTDPGVDDAAAVITALRLGLPVVGMSIVHGNVELGLALLNALRLKDLLKSDVKIYQGAHQPILETRRGAGTLHGRDGFGDLDWPPVQSRQEDMHAVDMILTAGNRYAGSLAILTLGPLTNIALALARDHLLAEKISHMVIMGGTCKGQGNTTMAGEFNFVADPEAAAIVLAAGIPITLVPWEVTLDNLIDRNDLDKAGPLAAKFLAMAHSLIEWQKGLDGREALILPDLFAAAIALDPDIMVESRSVYGVVETHGHYTRGFLALDHAGISGESPNIELCLGVDKKKVISLLNRALQT